MVSEIGDPPHPELYQLAADLLFGSNINKINFC